jgi:hypothetical protein
VSDRLKRLLVLELRRVVEDLESRRSLLIQVWGKHRARAPFLETTYSRWTTLGFSELRELEPAAATALDAFHRELDALRLYLAWTEDMPRQLAVVYDQALARLKTLAGMALTALGEAPLEPASLPWEE